MLYKNIKIMNYKFKILSEKNIDEIVDLVHKLNENKIPKNILTKGKRKCFPKIMNAWVYLLKVN